MVRVQSEVSMHKPPRRAISGGGGLDLFLLSCLLERRADRRAVHYDGGRKAVALITLAVRVLPRMARTAYQVPAFAVRGWGWWCGRARQRGKSDERQDPCTAIDLMRYYLSEPIGGD